MFNLNHLSKILAVSGVCLATLVGCGQAEEKKTATPAPASTDAKTIAVTAIVEHPSLDAVRKGLVEELANQGFKEGENLKVNFQSAQGNTATAGQIAKQFVSENPNAIVAIATPSAQSVVAATTSIPVVFAAVTDPVEAKLVKSWEASGTNVTGMSDQLPLDAQIDLIKKIVPNVQNIGYVYSPGEVNSTVVLKELETKLKPLNINVIPAPAQRTVDISQATRSLQGKVDVIYTSLDNNVVSAYEALYQAAKEMKVPSIASSTETVERGAIAALGVDYTEMGHEAGKIVAKILNGESAGTIKPMTMPKFDLHINTQAAKEIGLELPADLVKEATKVVDTIGKK